MSVFVMLRFGVDMHAVDFLADEGRPLDESNKTDESVSRRLDYALRYILSYSPPIRSVCADSNRSFTECEQKIIDIVRGKLAA